MKKIILIQGIVLFAACQQPSNKPSIKEEPAKSDKRWGYTLEDRKRIYAEAMEALNKIDDSVSAKYHVGEGRKYSKKYYERYQTELDARVNHSDKSIAKKYSINPSQWDSLETEAMVSGWTMNGGQ